MRIFLIGFMGSGKSYVGRRLGSLLGSPFIDLDEYVVQRAGAPIAEIFETHSEGYFRELEREVCLSLTPLPYFVMATGGGTPCYHNMIDQFNELGTTVFLDPPTEVLAARLGKDTDRPLLRGVTDLPAFIEDKLGQRRSCYERADIHLTGSDATDDAARAIFDLLAYQTT